MKRKNDFQTQEKKVKRQHEEYDNRPIIKIPLTEHWSTVITKHGDRFYFNSSRKKSFWQLPDEGGDEEWTKADQALSKFKNVIITIIGIVRGYSIEKFVWKTEKKELLLDQIQKVIGTAANDEAVQVTPETKEDDMKDTTTEISDTVTLKVNETGFKGTKSVSEKQQDVNEEAKGLQIGYESSSSGEEEQEQETAETKNEGKDSNENTTNNSSNSTGNEESSDEFGLDIDDLDDLDEGENTSIGDSGIFKEYKDDHLALNFINLLERKSIDPFSAYELEREKFMLEPEYIAVSAEKAEELFNYWCSKKSFSNENSTPNREYSEEEEEGKEEAPDNIKVYLEWMKSLDRIPKYYFELRRKLRHSDIARKIVPDERLVKHIFQVYQRLLKQNKGKKETLEALEQKVRSEM